MNETFITVKDAGGVYRPMYFVTPNDEAGKLRAEKVKLDDGEKLVVVSFTNETDYN